MPSSLFLKIQDDMKAAMRSKNADTLGTIRLLLAAIKQREVDERIELDDSQIASILNKMLKQRLDSIDQYRKGNREDLASKEVAEIEILKKYLPEMLSDDEVKSIIQEAIATTKASGVKDMAKVMAHVKTKAQGRADMASVSAVVKGLLGNIK